MPRVTITSPRYIGLRVNRYGPVMTNARLTGEVGLTSVPARWNRTIAQTGGIKPSATSAIPSGASGRPGNLGQPTSQLLAAANRTYTKAHMRRDVLSTGLTSHPTPL